MSRIGLMDKNILQLIYNWEKQTTELNAYGRWNVFKEQFSNGYLDKIFIYEMNKVEEKYKQIGYDYCWEILKDKLRGKR